MHIATWMNLRSITLSERSFMQKTTYYMIQFMTFQNKQNYSKKIRTVVASDGTGRDRLVGGMRELSGVLVMFYIMTGVWIIQVCISVNTHPVISVYKFYLKIIIKKYHKEILNSRQ